MRLFKRFLFALQIFLNDGLLIEFNHRGKCAVLKLKQFPVEGDSISVGKVKAVFTKK